jgi:hypothetical protein
VADVWPFLPLPEIDEIIEAPSAVHRREDDTSRFSMGSVRQTITLQYSARAQDWEKMRTLFLSNVLGEWLVPVWFEATAAAVLDTDTVIAADTNAEYVAGGLAIIWADCDTFTVVTVLSVAPGAVTLAAPVGTTYAAALIMPLRTALARQGMQLARPSTDFHRATIAFESIDGPDITTLIEPIQIQIALDVSPSMDIISFENFTRLDVAKANVISVLGYLESTGLPHDVRIVGWSESATSLERFDCGAADYQALRDFVAGLISVNATDFSQAFDGAAAFFSGTARRVFAFITDGEPTGGVAAAVILRDAIAGLEVYGVNIELTDTSATDQIDNTGGADVVEAGDITLRDSIVLSILGLTANQGQLFMECGGAVLEQHGGRIYQAATYVDSGRGPVAVEIDRSFVEELADVTLAATAPADRWRLKKSLHFLKGRDRPFRVAERVLPVSAATTSTATVAPAKGAVADWAGVEIEIDGAFRTVSSATAVTGGHRLSFPSLTGVPAGPVRVLRKVRQMSDVATIRHHRRAGWMKSTLVVGTP